ncbi:sensor histidine kinase [Brevibacillus daliensis]|uniref:sensor histidine kinase n=1 Tax=Brevibacillus daliensis TaxID=2892995 RepID=UPI001E4AB6C8|nr:HAMP domain-containing sensor histidine kinase [Brevibacillus daliensis]
MIDKFSLRNQPLARQIFFLFFALIIILATSVSIIYPYTLQKILYSNTFALLEEEFEQISSNVAFTQQNSVVRVPEGSSPRLLMYLLQHYRFSFEVLVYDTHGEVLDGTKGIPESVVDELYKSISTPSFNLQEGTLKHKEDNYLYVSQKLNFFDFPYYLVIFTRDRELIHINNIITQQFFVLFAILIGVSILLAIWFSGYLSKPLRKLEIYCQKIARRQFDIPLNMDRKDEIGQLARSFDIMKQQLKDYDQSQQHFVQNISHELKTPIMAIQGYTQGLIDGVFQGEEAKKGMAIIMEESDRLEKVVEQLLYLTKLESVDRMLSFNSLDLSEMLGFLHQRYQPLHNHLHWNISLPQSLPLLGDGEQISMAITNILENQLRYAKTTISITGELTQDAVHITIANDGPPIEESVLPNLFQRFRKGKTGKHGLGLAISRAVVEAHRGHISAENLPDDQGVQFQITLPMDPNSPLK